MIVNFTKKLQYHTRLGLNDQNFEIVREKKLRLWAPVPDKEKMS